ncbi:hypothetical protein QE152_g11179 [Popillia japonica]|uniref:Uncharacterized protein n=1 Tax=Popillia japonica TaxID=7064 RepID=A0AAW1LMQ7_POPJA
MKKLKQNNDNGKEVDENNEEKRITDAEKNEAEVLNPGEGEEIELRRSERVVYPNLILKNSCAAYNQPIRAFQLLVSFECAYLERVMSEKRKCVVWVWLCKGESASSIAPLYGVGRTTVIDIKGDAENIENHVSKMKNADGNVKARKTIKPAKLDQLDTVGFIPARSQGMPLTGPIMQAKAIEINKKLGDDSSFKARICANSFYLCLATSRTTTTAQRAYIYDFLENMLKYNQAKRYRVIRGNILREACPHLLQNGISGEVSYEEKRDAR